jgi:hypothetical protein
VNSNQLFRWRRQLLPEVLVESGVTVPVEIALMVSAAADGSLLRRGLNQSVFIVEAENDDHLPTAI